MTEEPWHKRTPGDPMPCKCGNSVVEVKYPGGEIGADRAKYWGWGKYSCYPRCEITDWRFVERKGEDVIAIKRRPVLTPAEPQLLALLSAATDDEADAIRSAARRADIEAPE